MLTLLHLLLEKIPGWMESDVVLRVSESGVLTPLAFLIIPFVSAVIVFLAFYVIYRGFGWGVNIIDGVIGLVIYLFSLDFIPSKEAKRLIKPIVFVAAPFLFAFFIGPLFTSIADNVGLFGGISEQSTKNGIGDFVALCFFGLGFGFVYPNSISLKYPWIKFIGFSVIGIGLFIFSLHVSDYLSDLPVWLFSVPFIAGIFSKLINEPLLTKYYRFLAGSVVMVIVFLVIEYIFEYILGFLGVSWEIRNDFPEQILLFYLPLFVCVYVEHKKDSITNEFEYTVWYFAVGALFAAICYVIVNDIKGKDIGVTEDEMPKVELDSLEERANRGDIGAQKNLAWLYYNGGENISQNPAKAFEWYKKAAEQGDAYAQYNLGVMYDNGEAVEANKEEAVKWYRKAARQGYAAAQNNLGVMYDLGEGTAEDEEEAFEWYKKAAEQGHVYAQNNLAWLYQHGKGVSRNKKEAYIWYWIAAEQSGDERIQKAKDQLGKELTDDEFHGAKDEAQSRAQEIRAKARAQAGGATSWILTTSPTTKNSGDRQYLLQLGV